MGDDGAQKLGRTGLVALVAGSMIGGGIFNLPQNMAAGAGAGAVLIAWVITGIGMFFLANSFRILAETRPELTGGIYTYARSGFGRFIGFEVAWGYWLSAAFGNVAFAVLIMEALSYFFPILGDGTNAWSILAGSALIWGMAILVLQGVRGAAILNVVATVGKLIPLGFIVIATLYAFRVAEFRFDFWGQEPRIGGLVGQIKSTMLVTLWAFIGIEGAVVVSGRAKRPEQVGQATIIALFACLLLYVLLSLFPFGVMHHAELAQLEDPSTAYLFASIVGNWGADFVNLGVIIAILGCWLSWTILVAEVPQIAAQDGTFPRFLAMENRKGAPSAALVVSSILMQVMMFVPLIEKQAWLFLLGITGVMVLPAYLASVLFLSKSALRKSRNSTDSTRETKTALTQPSKYGRGFMLFTGAMASVYAIWLLYAAGPKLLALSLILYALGIPIYWWTDSRGNHPKPVRSS